MPAEQYGQSANEESNGEVDAAWVIVKPGPPSGFSANADIYVDVSYAGTINAIGEGFTGQGGYAVAVQAGVGQGSCRQSTCASVRRYSLGRAGETSP
jgi:hypothetical protein